VNSPDRLKFWLGAVNIFDFKFRISAKTGTERQKSGLFRPKPLRTLGTCGKKEILVNRSSNGKEIGA
jgi:hypothetical protein